MQSKIINSSSSYSLKMLFFRKYSWLIGENILC